MHGRRRNIDAFEGVALFDGCSRRKLAVLARHADRLTLPAGRILSRAGHRADEVVVIISGDAQRADERGNVLGPGSVIGAAPVVFNDTYPDSVETRTDVEVLVLNGPAFRWAVQELPDVASRTLAGGAA